MGILGGVAMGYKVGSGIDKYIENLTNLALESDEMVKRAVYDGMAVVADSITASIGGIPTGSGNNGKITAEERDALRGGFGISKIENRGDSINVKTGFAGRNQNGTANVVVARRVESGTSKVAKYPFVSRAVSAARSAAEQAIAKSLDDQINKTMN